MQASREDQDTGLDAVVARVAALCPAATAIIAFEAVPAPRTRVLWCNRAMEALAGSAAAEIVGRPWPAILDPAAEAQTTAEVAAICMAGEAATIETLNRRPCGGSYGMETRLEPLDRDGDAGRWALFCSETGAAGHSGLIARAIDLSDDGFAVFDAEGRYEWANAAILRRIGLSLDAVRGRRFEEVVPFTDRTLPDAATLAACQARGEPYVTEVRYSLRQGPECNIRITAILVDDAGGRPHIVLTSHDLSELRRREADLAHAEDCAAVMERAIDSATEPVLLLDRDARIVEVNRAFTEVLGFTAEEAAGRDPLEILRVCEAEAKEIGSRMLDRDAPQPMEYEGVRTASDGRELWMEISVAPLPDSGGKAGFVVVMRNRTGRRRLQDERNRLTNLLAAALRGTGSVALSCDLRACTIVQSEGFREFLGSEPEGGVDLRDYLRPLIHPDDLSHCRATWRAHWRGETERAEAEWRFVHPERGPFWVRGRSRIERDADGKPLLLYLLITDIDRAKRTEAALTAAVSTAEEANRAKSSFLVTVSHEIRTPMNVVTGMCQLLKLTDLDHRQRGYAEMIGDASADLLTLIDDLLDLSRIEAGALRLDAAPFDLAEAVGRVADAAQVLPGAEGLAIRTEIEPGFHGMRLGDAQRVRQVLGNLAGNAVKVTVEGGVTISLCEAGDGSIRIEIADTGPGIAVENHEIIFEKFHQATESTPGRFRGAGLGLAICREIVELMGGRIGVESTSGQGATFWVELPLGRFRIAT